MKLLYTIQFVLSMGYAHPAHFIFHNAEHLDTERRKFMKFGQKLRQCRKSAGLSQEDLAQAAGISRRAIISYESGKVYPKSQDTYTMLAKVLGVDVSSLKNEYDDFIVSAADKYGYRGRKQAEQLVDEMGALFAGGTLSDDDMDGVMRALQEHYWRAKEINKKYTPKKYLNED